MNGIKRENIEIIGVEEGFKNARGVESLFKEITEKLLKPRGGYKYPGS
jgi:hypothetical protein